jgi:hypothetical protein
VNVIIIIARKTKNNGDGRIQWLLYVPAPLAASGLAFCVYGFCMILSVIMIIYLNSVTQLIFVMVKCGVLFEVRIEFLNIF